MAKRQIAVADAETDPFLYGRVPEPFLWGYYNEKEYEQFETTAEFVDFIKNRNEIIYFHNGGKFDFHFLIKYFHAQNIRIIHNRIVSVKIGLAELRDSYAILPVSLAEYQKDKIDYAKFEKSVRHKHMKEISKYLQNDCIYLYELVSAYLDLAGNKLTLAGNALAFSKKLGIDVGRTNKNFDEKFRGDYYFGGRCQAFKLGHFKNVNMYDIKSAYPFSMIHDHPTGDQFRRCTALLDKDRSELCFYKIRAKSYGAFARRAKGGGIYFPIEEGVFCTTGRELYAAIETNSCELIEIIECREFYRSINFSDYVNFWFNERKKYPKGSAKNISCKYMLNSLYGKTGQNPENFCDYYLAQKDDEIAKGWHLAAEMQDYDLHFRRHSENMMERLGDNYNSFPQFINIATAASITGHVRSILLRAIASQSENIIYCDTDSIFSHGELQISENLGGWQFEGVAKNLYMAGKKLYAAEMEDGSEKKASKGVKFSFEQIKKVSFGDSIEWKNDAPNFSLAKSTKFVKRVVSRQSRR